jgi:glycosyltransferase involved in cell wall biosynthesis
MNNRLNFSNKKVFVGPGNTAGNAHYIARSLRKAGVVARSYGYRAHEFGYPVDYQITQFRSIGRKGIIKLVNNRFILRPLNALIRLIFFISVLFRYDLFYFISPFTFFNSHRDLALLKFFGKQIAFFFPGCAEKNPHDHFNTMRYSDCWYCNDEKKQTFCLCLEPEKKRKRIQKFEKYADYIFSRPNTSGYLKKPQKTYPMWLMTDPPEKRVSLERYNQPSSFKIMHFPSHRELKGTRYVESALSKLGEHYDIEYLSKRMTNREVLKNLEKAHLLVDQFTHTFGLLAIEGMSRGCVVICRMEDWAKETYPDIPLVSCNPEDLESIIKDLLDNPGKMKEIAEKSVEWYQRNATLERVGEKLVSVFSGRSE